MKNNNKKQISFKSIFPKILSVVAAVILWFYVADIKTTTVEKVITGVPVNIVNFDSKEGSIDIVSGKEYLVDVTVSGLKSNIDKITSEDVSASVDMTGIDDSSEVYNLGIDVTSRSGITVKKTSPSEIAVRVDKTTSKIVPVVLSLSSNGTADDVCKVYDSSPIFSASTVQVKGSKKEIDKIEKMMVYIDVDTITETINAKAQTLVPVDKNGKKISSPYITPLQSTVDVTIPVYKRKKVEVSPVFEDELNYTYSYKLHPKEIVIEGESAQVNSITFVKTYPVDINKSSQNLDLPDGVMAFDEKGNNISTVTMTDIVATKIDDSGTLENENA